MNGTSDRRRKIDNVTLGFEHASDVIIVPSVRALYKLCGIYTRPSAAPNAHPLHRLPIRGDEQRGAVPQCTKVEPARPFVLHNLEPDTHYLICLSLLGRRRPIIDDRLQRVGLKGVAA